MAAEIPEATRPAKGGEDGESWRLFMAIDIPPELRPPLARLQRRLVATGADLRCTVLEQMHLTLVFIGDFFAARVPELSDRLRAAAGQSPILRMALRGLGTFGSPRSPRVVWAGVEAPATLFDLQQRLATAVRSFGVPLEDRSYHPHITLARVRSARGAAELTSLVRSLTNESIGEFEADAVVLYRSQIDRPRPVHTPLYRVALQPVR